MADDLALRQLVECAQLDGLGTAQTQLSPDGRWIAAGAWVPSLDANSRVSQLSLTSAITGETRQLAEAGPQPDPGLHQFSPRWAPDSQRLAFWQLKNGDATLTVLDLETGLATALPLTTPGPLRWSPDGSRIATVVPETPSVADGPALMRGVPLSVSGRPELAGPAGCNRLCVVELASATLQLLTSPSMSVGSFNWSPDGSDIVYSAYCVDPSDEFAFLHGSLFVVHLNGGTTRLLLDQPGWDRDPAWSPDGQWITFVSQGGVLDYY